MIFFARLIEIESNPKMARWGNFLIKFYKHFANYLKYLVYEEKFSI